MRAGVVGGLLLLGLFVSCGAGDEAGTERATTTTGAEPPAPTTGGSSGDDAADAPGPTDDAAAPDGSPPPTASDGADGTGSDAPDAAPAGITAPVAGRYDYEVQREGPAPSRTTLRVEEIVEADGVVQQFQRFDFEDQRRLWVWEPGSVVIDRTETASDPRYGGAGYACVWSEPPVVLKAPLEVGQRWETETSCSFAVDGEEVVHDATEQREVVERRVETVGGRQVELVVLERRTVLVSSGPRPFTQTVTSLDAFAPSVGLLVRSDTTAVLEEPGGARRGARSRLQLLGLTPNG